MNGNKYSFGRVGRLLLLAMFGVVLVFGSSAQANAQALGWEGETGVFVTPLAYTASAEGQKFHPVVAYHYFNAGSVIGDFHEASIEMGVGKRFEFGYTREFHNFGGNAELSPLWQDGFDIFNAKYIVIRENSFNSKWVPAISAGIIARTGVRNVGDYVKWVNDAKNSNGSHNEDFYAVATKFVPTPHAGPLAAVILNAGIRETNAELWGMGGNAPDWTARGFGALGFAFKGPDKSTIVFAAEASQKQRRDGTQYSNLPHLLRPRYPKRETQVELRYWYCAGCRRGLRKRSDGDQPESTSPVWSTGILRLLVDWKLGAMIHGLWHSACHHGTRRRSTSLAILLGDE